MKWVYAEYGKGWTDESKASAVKSDNRYGELSQHQEAIRKHIKSHFKELKEKQIKDLLDSKIWLSQQQILLKAKQLQQVIGTDQCDDMNGYEDAITSATKTAGIKLDPKEKKQITTAVSWKNPDAEKVIRRSSASMPPQHTGHPDHKKISMSTYGIYKIDGQYVEYKADGDLRDNENVALDPGQPVNHLNEAYFAKEVQPHVPDAWIDANKKDDKDQQIGIVGYEIPFNRHFYVYQPPRDLSEIDADLDKVSGEIMALLREVHS